MSVDFCKVLEFITTPNNAHEYVQAFAKLQRIDEQLGSFYQHPGEGWYYLAGVGGALGLFLLLKSSPVMEHPLRERGAKKMALAK